MSLPLATRQRDLQLAQIRLRKAHRKSRHGCANCKLRRVKCDETKPSCLKCVSFGVGCSYIPGAPEMHLAFTGTFKVDLPPVIPLPRHTLEPPLYLPLAGERSNELYEMNSYDRAILSRFRNTTILTVCPEESASFFQETTLKLTQTSPYLMHIILALTLIFDMHVAGQQDTKKLAALAFHFYHGVTLFNAKLSSPIAAEDKDALWSAAALTGSSAFADVRATKVTEAWPLSPPSPTDVDWMKLTGGKQAVYQLTNPKRHGSSFHGALTAFDHLIPPRSVVDDGFRNLPPKFAQLYGLDKSSTIETNPYHYAAAILDHIMPLDMNRTNIPKFLSFVGFPQPSYLKLLEQRDPRALLLLAYWYAKSLNSHHWWIWRRASLEGPAICIVLERTYAGDPELLELLEFPKTAFAAASNNPPIPRKPIRANQAPAQISV